MKYNNIYYFLFIILLKKHYIRSEKKNYDKTLSKYTQSNFEYV